MLEPGEYLPWAGHSGRYAAAQVMASGEALPRSQDELAITGHAIEARMYAEDPANGFGPDVEDPYVDDARMLGLEFPMTWENWHIERIR